MIAEHRRNEHFVGVGLASLAALAFGTLAIFAKYAYEREADAVPLLAARFAIAAALLGGFHAFGRRPALPRGRLVGLLLLGALGYGFEASLFFVALEHAPAGTVALIFYSFPLWTTLMSLAAGLERFRWNLIAALALGTAGVSLIFTVSTDDLRGPLLALAAAVAVAIYFTLAQVVARGVPPSQSAFYTAAGAAVALGVVGALTRQNLPAAALPHAAALGVATAIAFALLFGAIARIGSARSSVAAMLEPVATVVLAALFLNEAITARIALGAALIVSALPVLASTGVRGDVPPPPDAL